LSFREPVKVATRGGDLRIEWHVQKDGNDDYSDLAKNTVLLTGPAVTVFTGAIDL
jgi:diaminopimelate epimerase